MSTTTPKEDNLVYLVVKDLVTRLRFNPPLQEVIDLILSTIPHGIRSLPLSGKMSLCNDSIRLMWDQDIVIFHVEKLKKIPKDEKSPGLGSERDSEVFRK